MKVLFGGKNYFAPLKNPRKILDVGTGTGKWCIEMGMGTLPKASSANRAN
jgi:metalloendopeptidase OMA1, mitochondrial